MKIPNWAIESAIDFETGMYGSDDYETIINMLKDEGIFVTENELSARAFDEMTADERLLVLSDNHNQLAYDDYIDSSLQFI